MNKLKKTVSMYALDDTKIINHVTRPSMFGFRLVGALALGFLLMFALLPQLNITPTLAYNATLRIEINPAFDVMVDQDDLVVDIIKLNDDAQNFDTQPWIGKSVEEVINALIAYALEAGFIDEEALESDVVSISIITDEDDDDEVKEAIDNLGARIQERLRNQEEAMKVDVIFIKATLRELFEAEGKEVPLGLYVLQGKALQDDGSLIPMKEFLAQNPEKAEHRNERGEAYTLKAFEKQINMLKNQGVDTEELERELESMKDNENRSKESLKALKEHIKDRQRDQEGKDDDQNPSKPKDDANHPGQGSNQGSGNRP
ncbi:MAG: hypothetical protein KGZ84_07360 [Erysipelotrichia bacterium]|jgi:chaperonin cofactor prefoldin|nr:hypothetical protein [Erysipelotrichia bacterium]